MEGNNVRWDRIYQGTMSAKMTFGVILYASILNWDQLTISLSNSIFDSPQRQAMINVVTLNNFFLATLSSIRLFNHLLLGISKLFYKKSLVHEGHDGVENSSDLLLNVPCVAIFFWVLQDVELSLNLFDSLLLEASHIPYNFFINLI